MAKILRGSCLVTIYLVALLLLPGAYTTGDVTEATEATSTEATPAPTPEPSPSEATSESSPTSDPTPISEPSPTSTEPSSPDPAPSKSPKPEARVSSALTLSLNADPVSLLPGESTTVTAQLDNDSPAGAEGVDLTLVLPLGLEYVSSSPTADDVSTRPDGTAIIFNSLDIGAGSSIAPVVQATVATDAKKSLTIRGDVVWTDGQASDQATLEIGTPETNLSLKTSGGGFLKKVGGQVAYDISVKNTGEDPAEDVTLINIVPAEVHVTGAGLAPGVDAVQVGNSGGKEDVVWVINELPANETVRVNYTGTIKSAGDLEAVNKTRVVSTNAGRDSSEERTYLATAGGSGSNNPSYESREKRVTRERVVERPLVRKRVATEPGAPGSSEGSELPFTGIDPLGTVMLGMVLIALGMVTMHATSVNTDRRRIAAASFTLLLVAGACMSNGGDEVEPRVLGTQLTRSPDAGPAEGDDPSETEPDDVTDPGQEDTGGDETTGPTGSDDGVDNGDGPNNGDGPGTGVDEDDDGLEDSDGGPDTTSVLVPGDPVVTFERDVDFVTITEDDLPVRHLASSSGSTMNFGWNDQAGSITHVTSSNAPIDGVADLSAQLSQAGPGMKLTVSVTNVTDETVLGVNGTLAVELSAGGSTHTLRAGGLDLELNPGGTTSSSYSFRLPSGSYSAQAVFLSS